MIFTLVAIPWGEWGPLVVDMGNKSSSLQGFLWIHPNAALEFDALDRRRAASSSSSVTASAGIASSREQPAGPAPAWFEVNPASQELQWQLIQLKDIIVDDAEFKERPDAEELVLEAAASRGSVDRPSVDLSSIHTVKALHGDIGAIAPFTFLLEGSRHSGPWRLLLQAPCAQDMASWLMCLRRFVASLWASIPEPSVVLFQAVRAGDGGALLGMLPMLRASRGRAEPARDGSGNTVLLSAAASGNMDVIQPLLASLCNGSDEYVIAGRLTDVNLDGWTVLHSAVSSGLPRLVSGA